MKYAFFTGAAGGLGGASARAMAKEGWTIFAADINEVALEEIGREENIIPIKVDITSEESIEAAFNEVSQVTDKLDAVINFSGIHNMSSLVEGDIIKTLEKMIDINVMGMVRVNKILFPLVEAGKGRIVNCSSECGWMKAQPFNGPYTITKYAVEAYSDSLHHEMALLGIPVIKIQPGSFKTNMHADAESGFDRLIGGTTHYRKALKRMKPLMMIELKMANDPKYLVEAVLESVNAVKPKFRYKVKNSKLLGSMEIIPNSMLGSIYKMILG
ncbi:MAG: SDR family NAD(P)-dependent oxidoreductase [Oscillospiraceae bacterium]|jgi:NAD(P)-dependent dehydrogenase (short-subunit alcohol dehydrogenase family)|nr:SDR family NAD(P)-dependent oxidoreductase [Oscillospiraceae bacterium]